MRDRKFYSVLIEAMLWLVFLGSFIDPYTMKGMEVWVNLLSVQLGGALLIVLSLRNFKHLKSYIAVNRAYLALPYILGISIWGTLYGLVLGPSSFSAVFFNSLLVYASATLILSVTEEDVRKRLLITFHRQLFVAFFFGLYALTTSPTFQDILIQKELWVNSFEKPASMVLILVPFFLGYTVRHTNGKLTALAVGAYLVVIALGLRGTSRATFVINFLVIPLAISAVALKSRAMKGIPVSMKFGVPITLALGIIILLQPGFKFGEDLGKPFVETIWRLTGSREWAGARELRYGVAARLEEEAFFSRGAEAEDFLGSLTWVGFIAGNGFGVPWFSHFWGREWDMVHTGPLHLIYRGGLPLLLAYYSILILAIITSWRNAKTDKGAMGCFCFLVVWLFRLFSYGAHLSTYYTYIFWLVVGLALSTDLKNTRASKNAPLPGRRTD